MIKQTARITLGIILVIIGLIGGLIPIFQGWMFGIPGLIILADYFPPAKRLLDWAKKKAGTNKKENE
ncbi:PGPGW domain-containing protein [Candidatus Marinimicrobia bacterium]|nr:PGPGW domain-containing protein [Candidatus Neomarinimicrobiota bacterium]